ncbi:MAG: hypothetical protein R3C16_07525 [Hyphomonadaceae bacterium]
MSAAAEAVVELRAERVGNLFDPFDPFPLPSRDLSPAAEAFIVGWAREVPSHAPLRIVGARAGGGGKQRTSRHARRRHLAPLYRSGSGGAGRRLSELFHVGRVSLLIRLAVLAASARALFDAALGDTPAARFAAEGVIILGWVANWRPLEIFLYDWWPLRRRRKLYQRLAAAPVELRSI